MKEGIALIVAGIGMLSVLIAPVALMQAHEQQVIPTCEEDAVLIGRGDFSNGRWTFYVCGPSVDDYNTEVTK